MDRFYHLHAVSHRRFEATLLSSWGLLATLRGRRLHWWSQSPIRTILRLGTVGFGGPIALVGYMHRDLVENRRWVSNEDYLEGLAFSQLSPGPLAAQLANYLGWVHSGTLGRKASWEWLFSAIYSHWEWM
jgi:hypothetical protein